MGIYINTHIYIEALRYMYVINACEGGLRSRKGYLLHMLYRAGFTCACDPHVVRGPFYGMDTRDNCYISRNN